MNFSLDFLPQLMFCLNLPFDLIHYVTKQGEYFHTVIMPSRVQICVACGHP